MYIKFYFSAFFLFFSSCINQTQDINAIYTESALHDSGLEIEINYYFNDNLEFKLIASKIENFSDPVDKSVFSKGIKVLVYDNVLDTIATIVAETAIQNKESKLIELRKNVILKNLKEETLNTETLFWNQQEKTIYTDDFVTINTENEIIMGYGFVTDQSFSTYSLSNITGTIYI